MVIARTSPREKISRVLKKRRKRLRRMGSVKSSICIRTWMYPIVSPPTFTGTTRSLDWIFSPVSSPKVALITSCLDFSFTFAGRPIADGFVLSMTPICSSTMDTSRIPDFFSDSTYRRRRSCSETAGAVNWSTLTLIALDSSRKLSSSSFFSDSRPIWYGMYTEPREQAKRISMTIVSLNRSPRSRKGTTIFMAPPTKRPPAAQAPGGCCLQRSCGRVPYPLGSPAVCRHPRHGTGEETRRAGECRQPGLRGDPGHPRHPRLHRRGIVPLPGYAARCRHGHFHRPVSAGNGRDLPHRPALRVLDRRDLPCPVVPDVEGRNQDLPLVPFESRQRRGAVAGQGQNGLSACVGVLPRHRAGRDGAFPGPELDHVEDEEVQDGGNPVRENEEPGHRAPQVLVLDRLVDLVQLFRQVEAPEAPCGHCPERHRQHRGDHRDRTSPPHVVTP